MRKRIWISGSVALAILLLLIFASRHRRETGSKSSVVADSTTTTLKTRRTAESTPQIQAHEPSSPNTITRSPQSAIDISNKLYQQEEADWRKPIEFYGKVVDENNNPIVGAHVQFQWRGRPDESASTSATESDSQGLFKLEGKTGRSLLVSVDMSGYYNSKHDKTAFLYSLAPDIYIAQQWNPVIFHLQKKSSGESLVESAFPPGMQIAQLRHDGTPVEIDLLNGQKTAPESGQLKLEFWRDVSEKNANRFDWKLRLSTPSGGIIPSEKEFSFEAPEAGYQTSIEIDMSKTNQLWLSEIRRKYYIKLPDGKFGRFDFYLLADNGVFTVHASINPSGSRNLEPK